MEETLLEFDTEPVTLPASDERRLGFLLAWIAERSLDVSMMADVSESDEGGWFSSAEDEL